MKTLTLFLGILLVFILIITSVEVNLALILWEYLWTTNEHSALTSPFFSKLTFFDETQLSIQKLIGSKNVQERIS